MQGPVGLGANLELLALAFFDRILVQKVIRVRSQKWEEVLNSL
jgi:hypothetical protein